MIPFVAFFRTKAGLCALALIAVAIVCLSLVAYGAAKERKAEAARAAIAVAEARALDDQADAKSNRALQSEAVQIAETRKELEDAVAQAPESLPDAASVAYGCRELQRNGVRTSDLPACQPAGG